MVMEEEIKKGNEQLTLIPSQENSVRPGWRKDSKDQGQKNKDKTVALVKAIYNIVIASWIYLIWIFTSVYLVFHGGSS